MIELGREKRQSIGTMCKASSEVLVRGAAEGTMGRVWVPGLENAPYCLIVAGDFAYIYGIPPKGARALELRSQIYESASQAFLYPSDERWAQWLEEQFAGQLRAVSRYALKKGEHRFDRKVLKGYVDRVPKGIRVKRVDERLYQLTLKEEWSRDLCANFENFTHFQAHGLGYGAMKGHKIVAGCWAYGASEGMMEVQVKTKKEYRRQGLALGCSAAFLLECLEKDIIPNWEATNQQSVELALKLGYIYDREYQVYRLLDLEET
ncbi:MAG: GNAT family N-acetyltransferase [Hungatella sp.]|nr:GNAT family N-acetyltransferase [Hungatella sp.]MCI9635081.1 GNAT family N-acetyltransferase [Hungatella sp.]